MANGDKFLLKRKSNDSTAVSNKVVKRRGPIRRRRRIIEDRPVDFSGKKYFMVVRRTIPRNERIENAANDTTKPLIECTTCRKNNEYLEALESQIERVKDASNALETMCRDKRTQNNAIDAELDTILAGMGAEDIMLVSKNMLSLFETTGDSTAKLSVSKPSVVSRYLSPEPDYTSDSSYSNMSLSPDYDGVFFPTYDAFTNPAASPLSDCEPNAFETPFASLTVSDYRNLYANINATTLCWRNCSADATS